MNKDIFKIQKTKLEGKVKVSGAKNNALKLLTASVLTNDIVEIYNSPNLLLDMQVHIGMLNQMGKQCFEKDGYLKIQEINLIPELNWDERSIRNSLLILGCLTTRFGRGSVPLPGGCKLGDRKYDIHVMILRELGAKVWEEEGYLFTSSKGRLKGTDLYLPIRSTGATENAILCASLAEGKTTIWNPHIRPEIIDLIFMLNKMGAKIKVFGQKCIEVLGVNKLNGVSHTAIPDNMEALTWAIGSVVTNGEIEIENFPFEHLEVPLIYLRESGMKYFKNKNSLIVRGGTPYPIEISTGPYPGINSDMQPLFAVYSAMSKGDSKIIDLRFPGRYEYAEQLGKMGMNYEIIGDMLIIKGGNQLNGTNVTATDLRAGISLLLAGLTADGETIINNAWQIERGYEKLDQKLKSLGAKFK
ncbi:UDP-N-acetylglucosamine 1-carboxyvinyltransferase [Croceibacter atlanticus]|uniref:UDP-N-acetylglucosamine 1-carboxyvinyltransferase n=1 Tax=Croceibacter atlanticus TaxID=313588 RepID=UPI002E16355C|nr:UDP-N-acetylglucosamine 1-carboxyvinyltransferase [Croceibacter atlanticus]